MNQPQQNPSHMAGMIDPNSREMTAVPVSRRHQFFIKHTLPTGEVLEGQFTSKKLSIKEMASVSVRKSQLNGGYYHDEENPGQGIDADTDWTHQMIAHLEHALIQAPVWFNMDDIWDVDLLIKVFGEVAKFENTFASPQPNAAVNSGGSQADSGGTSQESGAAGSVAAVGGNQVSDSLDP